MLSIDHLQLHLPEGFEHRARDITRLVAEQLADLPLAESRRLEQLSVPALEIDPTHSDRQIAGQIVGAIHQGVVAVVRGTVARPVSEPS